MRVAALLCLCALTSGADAFIVRPMLGCGQPASMESLRPTRAVGRHGERVLKRALAPRMGTDASSPEKPIVVVAGGATLTREVSSVAHCMPITSVRWRKRSRGRFLSPSSRTQTTFAGASRQLSRRLRYRAARLCGNQISGGPRHRRDVLAVTASARWRVGSTPSTRRCLRNCGSSMAWRFTKVSAIILRITQLTG